MHHFGGLMRKLSSSASAERLKKKQHYLNNGSAVLEELLAVCDGNCRIPLRYLSATEIENAIKQSGRKIAYNVDGDIVTGSLDNRLVLVRFNNKKRFGIHRDIAITAQMSHLKNVLRLFGCCLEFAKPVLVYEYVEAISLCELLFNEGNHDRARRPLSWESRLRIVNEVASTVVYLHTEFSTPIIHRDIKPSKVIIDQISGAAKMVDFSLSISLPPGKLEVKDDVCGTILYIDPEYVRSGIVTQKTDVYSLGVLLFQLLTGKSWQEIIDIRVSTPVNVESQLQSYIKEGSAIDIADPAILEEHGIEIRQHLEDYLDLVKKCAALKGEDGPYMIQVAKELRRIENCFRDHQSKLNVYFNT
ncbi:serine/threonine-protein kinase ZRK1-like [Nicotiana tomentosiformis]|uniref:serine/threonine-protein kinase ZRK1-like n=1 Tax=Nicotiana tomentosiformis TaxID=4098 RepID=UPI0008781C23